MQVVVPDTVVVCRGMVFGEVVGLVLKARAPIHIEMFLLDPILDPIEVHVGGVGGLLMHCH